jgi:hypothetical protein
MYWTKKEYIKSRTQYYKTEYKLSLKFAKECAISDWELYVEKYGYNEIILENTKNSI